MLKRMKTRRHRTVTDEHIEVAPELLGRPLASPARRGWALCIDLVLSFLAYLLCLVLLLKIQDPQFLTRFTTLFSTQQTGGEEQLENLRGFLLILDDRCPKIFTAEEKNIIHADSLALLREWQGQADLTITMNFSDTSTFDSKTRHLSLGGDVLYGRLNSVLSKVTFFLLYFTFVPWIMRGKTPGKWLLRIRIRRLDGQKLTLWDTFSRAGGYSASLSTGGLGFLEALWDRNRQTIHDKIAGTAVIRVPSKRTNRRKLRKTAVKKSAAPKKGTK